MELQQVRQLETGMAQDPGRQNMRWDAVHRQRHRVHDFEGIDGPRSSGARMLTTWLIFEGLHASADGACCPSVGLCCTCEAGAAPLETMVDVAMKPANAKGTPDSRAAKNLGLSPKSSDRPAAPQLHMCRGPIQ
eukprot:1953759-Pyramimonas_sp.AAC.3